MNKGKKSYCHVERSGSNLKHHSSIKKNLQVFECECIYIQIWNPLYSASVTVWFRVVGRSITTPGAFQHSLLIKQGAVSSPVKYFISPLLSRLFAHRNYRPLSSTDRKVSKSHKKSVQTNCLSVGQHTGALNFAFIHYSRKQWCESNISKGFSSFCFYSYIKG